MFALYEGWSCWEPSKLIDALQLSQSSPHPQVIDQIQDPTTSFASVACFIQRLRQRCRWWWWWYRIFTYKRYFGTNGVWLASTLRILTNDNISTEQGVIDLGISRDLDSKTFWVKYQEDILFGFWESGCGCELGCSQRIVTSEQELLPTEPLSRLSCQLEWF